MNTFFHRPILLLCLAAFSGCATTQNLVVTPSETEPETETVFETVKVLRGKASYYYGRWIGRLTANGETYRATDVTAAHKSLPFDTKVRVTNLLNNKSVVVRINNRGPYIRGRILDLSLEAAKTIQMTKAGVVPVKAEVLKEIEVIKEPNTEVQTPNLLAALARLVDEPEQDED